MRLKQARRALFLRWFRRGGHTTTSTVSVFMHHICFVWLPRTPSLVSTYVHRYSSTSDTKKIFIFIIYMHALWNFPRYTLRRSHSNMNQPRQKNPDETVEGFGDDTCKIRSQPCRETFPERGTTDGLWACPRAENILNTRPGGAIPRFC